VASKCPHLFYICKAHGLAVRSALELLISNPLESRAPVAPALVERVSRHWSVIVPFEGSIFRVLGSGHARVTLTW
jgi:hypothetical protein